MSDARIKQRVERVLVDLLRSHARCAALALDSGKYVDRLLVRDAQTAGTQLLEDVRLGEVVVDKWAPPIIDNEESEN